MRSPTKAQQIADLTEQLKESRAISADLVSQLEAAYKVIEIQNGMSGKLEITPRDEEILKAAIHPESRGRTANRTLSNDL